jgi:hypothetical protein
MRRSTSSLDIRRSSTVLAVAVLCCAAVRPGVELPLDVTARHISRTVRS